jgi:hypothetical protein
MRYLLMSTLKRTSHTPVGSFLSVLRGLLNSLIVLSLPPGAGLALITLVSALAWRLLAFLSAIARCDRYDTKRGAGGDTVHPRTRVKACCVH